MAARIIINGGEKLCGEVSISGSKNSSLPILAAVLLARSECVLENVPHLWDIRSMYFLLRTLGARVEEYGDAIRIMPPAIMHHEAPYELVKTMRASFLVLGPLLARLKKARVSLPGGCLIGSRPVDLHLKGLEQLGANIKLKEGYAEAETSGLKGNRIYLESPSVGATENLMMAASLAEGKTFIENAAREPEITDLADFLNAMGAKVKNAGQDLKEIEGVDHLDGVHYKIIPDRVEAGTFAMAIAATGGEAVLKNANAGHLKAMIVKLQEMGVKIESDNKNIYIKSPEKKKGVEVKSQPYPGFPTDLQPQMMSLTTICSGTSVITETIFENRFMHVGELRRMGAEIDVKGNIAVIKGVEALNGASVMASDIRAGAALVVAGLAAKSETKISRIYHIDRGYEDIEKKFSSLGAKIKRTQ